MNIACENQVINWISYLARSWLL